MDKAGVELDGEGDVVVNDGVDIVGEEACEFKIGVGALQLAADCAKGDGVLLAATITEVTVTSGVGSVVVVVAVTIYTASVDAEGQGGSEDEVENGQQFVTGRV